MFLRVINISIILAMLLPAVHANAVPYENTRTDTLFLSLGTAVKMALEHNEDIKIARSAFDKARGQKQEAFASALPKLSAELGYTRNILRPVIFFPNPETDEIMQIEIGEKNDFRASLLLTQPLFAFGRIGGAIKIADYFLRSSEKDAESVEQTVVLQAKEAYYGVLLAREALVISRQTLTQAQRHFRETMLMFQQQMASRFDSLRAEVSVKNTVPAVIASENAVNLALLDLKRTIGIDRSTPVKLTGTLEFESVRYDLESVIAKAYESRPDIQSLRLRVNMAQKIYKVTRRFNYPFLSAFGSYFVEGQESDKFFPSSDKIASSLGVGLSLSVPLFDGFANRGKIKQAKADYNIARYSLDKIEKAVALQITQLYDELAADVKNLNSQKATVAMAEEAYRLAVARYRNGVSTSLELSDTELALTTARLNYIEAKYRCIITGERLANAIGY